MEQQPLRTALSLYYTDTIRAGQYIRMNESLYSKNGRFNAKLNRQGNLVIYDNWAMHETANEKRPQDQKSSIYAHEMFDIIWSSAEYGRSLQHPLQIKCVLTHDCNVAIYEISGDYYWSTGAKGAAKEDIKLVMDDDGCLVLYGDDKAVWASK